MGPETLMEIDDSIRHFRSVFEKSFPVAVGDQNSVTLMWPSLEYSGRSSGGSDLPMTSWTAIINMYVDADEFDEKCLPIGILELHTLPLSGDPGETLDAVSTDTASYMRLFGRGGDFRDSVEEQFDYPNLSGLLIVDRAYVHPALRNRNIGAWSVVQAVHDLTFGASVFVAACPSPTEPRTGQSTETGAARLATYWEKSGLQRIDDCPTLVGQTTDGPVFSCARETLANVASIEVTFRPDELKLS